MSLGLLHQIQKAVAEEDSRLGSVLLKLQILAAKLGSGALEEWVRYELEGYPKDANIPDYRVVDVSYKGMFMVTLGRKLEERQIPLSSISKIAGDSWLNYRMIEDITAIGGLTEKSFKEGFWYINEPDLALSLRDNVNEGHPCNEAIRMIPYSSLTKIQQTVRSRIIKLTSELEKSNPAITNITFDHSENEKANPEKVQQIFQQIIHGDVGTAVVGGHEAKVSVNIKVGDKDSLIKCLEFLGIPKSAAAEFAQIVEAERPASKDEPFGQNAKNWIKSNIGEAVKGVSKMGASVATKVLTEAVLRYHGLK